MIYTVASTLPPDHGGRTKSLLKRIDFLNEQLDFDQTILTKTIIQIIQLFTKIFITKGYLKEI